jgi:hypothetical protein
MTTAIVDGPVEVQMSFANMPLNPGEVAMLYWDTGIH